MIKPKVEPISPVRNKAAIIGVSYFLGSLTASAVINTDDYDGIGDIIDGGFTFASVMLITIAALLLISIIVTTFEFSKKPHPDAKAGDFAKTARIKISFAALRIALFSFCIGLIGFIVYDETRHRPILRKSGETVVVEGTVTEIKELALYTSTYLIKTRIDNIPTKILVMAPSVYGIEAGDKIGTEITLSRFYDTEMFPEQSYNWAKGIPLKGDSDNIILLEKGEKGFLSYVANLNGEIKNKISARFPDDSGGLLRAMFLGDKSSLSSGRGDNIKLSGASHYTAVSGLHLTLMVQMIMVVLSLTPIGKNRRVKFTILVIIVSVLVVFFGFKKSIIRAALMMIICQGGDLFLRKGKTLDSLGFALFIILIFEPQSVFDIGMTMSFLGTFGVGVVAPEVKSRLGGKMGEKINSKSTKLGMVVDPLIASSCASLCVLPAAAFYFGGTSLLSPITGIALVPFFMVSTISLVIMLPLSAFPSSSIAEIVERICLSIAGLMSDIMGKIIDLIANVEMSWLSLRYPFISFWIAASIILLVVIHLFYDDIIKTLKAAILSILALTLMTSVYNMNVINSGKIYINIYSDGTTAFLKLRQRGTEIIIITDDSPRAYTKVKEMANVKTTAIVLIDSKNNYESAFKNLPCDTFISLGNDDTKYDISGRFMLSDANNNTTLEFVDNDGNDRKILFTRASNDKNVPINADMVIATGWVKNRREFSTDMIIYSSRSMKVQSKGENNAYYEPIYLIF